MFSENALTLLSRLFWLAVLLSAPFQASAADWPRELGRGYAAEVAGGRVALDQVLEVWAPVWYETLTRVRSGKISAAEGDRRLSDEWTRSLDAIIKDEVFYQEAVREMDALIKSIIDQQYRQARDNNAPYTRSDIEKKIKAIIRKDLDNNFRALTNEYIRESGGMPKLRKVLAGRGLTYEEWQKRLEKKAYAVSYLNTMISSRSVDPTPKEIRDYYAAHSDEFTQPGPVKFRHILFSSDARGGEKEAKKAATEVWRAIMSKEYTIEEAARKFSDDKESAGKGGLETAAEATDPEREAWLSELRQALKEEKPNVLGPILESPVGFHLVELIEVMPDKRTPFKEANKAIKSKIQNTRWTAQTDQLYKRLRTNTPVKIFVPDFPPTLSCAAQANRGGDIPAVYRIGRAALPGVDIE